MQFGNTKTCSPQHIYIKSILDRIYDFSPLDIVSRAHHHHVEPWHVANNTYIYMYTPHRRAHTFNGFGWHASQPSDRTRHLIRKTSAPSWFRAVLPKLHIYTIYSRKIQSSHTDDSAHSANIELRELTARGRARARSVRSSSMPWILARTLRTYICIYIGSAQLRGWQYVACLSCVTHTIAVIIVIVCVVVVVVVIRPERGEAQFHARISYIYGRWVYCVSIIVLSC